MRSLLECAVLAPHHRINKALHLKLENINLREKKMQKRPQGKGTIVNYTGITPGPCVNTSCFLNWNKHNQVRFNWLVKAFLPMQTEMTISVICNDNFGVKSFTSKLFSGLRCRILLFKTVTRSNHNKLLSQRLNSLLY